MKEELQGKLVEILTSLQAAAGKASDFAAAQLPEIAQSYIAYGRASSIAVAVVAVLMLVGAWLLFNSGEKRRKADVSAWTAKHPGEDGPDWYQVYDPFMQRMVAAMVSGLSFMLLMLGGNKALLVWFAPKVWLLKEIAGMLR